MTPDTLSLVTLNVNGMRGTPKRRRILQFCKLLQVDVVLLQETHISCESDVHLWSLEWGGGLYASFGSGASCGTVILVSPKLCHCVGKVEKDHEGRVVCIHLRLTRGGCLYWHKPDGTVSSRLDRFYAPRKFPRSRCSIISCPLSDHDAVVLRLQLPESFHVEKGLWRLNTEIVKEQNFKEQFVEKYRGWQSLKPAFPNALVWWDEVKSLIKQFAIRYCVERAHQRRFKFHSLCNRARDGSHRLICMHLECFSMRNCTEPECVPESSLLRRTRSPLFVFTGTTPSLWLTAE
ncbi:pol-like protein [Apostichopus japonicus]|uniref:exodeoxyribonuclease III n=1 Tax=Stichopus japonicus TaxID=307972 RepID=A0A2G8K451_STIJA|nr:pol-like protein [Apostichopus japonicus]